MRTHATRHCDATVDLPNVHGLIRPAFLDGHGDLLVLLLRCLGVFEAMRSFDGEFP